MSDDVEQLRRAIDQVIAAARLGIPALETPAERSVARAALDVVVRNREQFSFLREKQEPPE